MTLAAALCALALAAPQDRPSEDAMFGEAPAAAPADAGTAPARPSEDAMFGESAAPAAADAGIAEAPGAAQSRDEAQLSGPALKSRFDTEETASDPLKIGGTLYLRAQTTWLDNTPPEKWTFAAPALLDAYLDARPNERIRGFALARLRYDPSLPGQSTTSFFPGAPAATSTNPSVALDQLWIKFDVAKTVFVTAGRQKVKWGTGRLWQPTDFLNNTRRDPLAPFDQRLGINAVKVHVPVESLGWNFYGFGLLDNDGPASVLGKVGGALRAEFVLGQTELGLDGVWVKGRRPRYGVDLSSALGPIDAYVDVAFRDGHDFTVWKPGSSIDPTRPFDTLYEATTPEGIQVMVAGGLAWTVSYNEKNTLTVGAEYFYNPVGTDSKSLYPWLLYQGTYTPFYAGKHYAGLFVIAPGLPDLPWVTMSFNALLNASDPSGIVRLDAFFRVLTYLQLEAFVSANVGGAGGEFRFGLDLPPIPLGDGTTSPAVHVAPPNASAGVGLRISI